MIIKTIVDYINRKKFYRLLEQAKSASERTTVDKEQPNKGENQ